MRGKLIRKSLEVRSWTAAQKIVQDWEIYGIKNVMTIDEALDRFIDQHEANGSAPATIGKFKLLRNECIEFFADMPLREIGVDDIARYRESWSMSPISAKNKIERLRSFFKFCMEREWMERNPASPLKLPKIVELERKPYEAAELEKIWKAVEKFPNWGIYGEKNRERVKAFLLVLRWTGMRIGDAVQLEKSKIVDGQITLRTEKNNKRVSIPAHPEVLEALEKLTPSPYYFWSGNGTVKSAVSDWQRTIMRLAKIAKIRVHAHRFRHTFACELLAKGVPVSEVAAILGNSPRIVEKHYSQWIETRQAAINKAVKGMWS